VMFHDNLGAGVILKKAVREMEFINIPFTIKVLLLLLLYQIKGTQSMVQTQKG